MYGDIKGVYKNPRYRILSMDNSSYIMDVGDSLWKIFIPFVYWFLPHKVYKIEDYQIVEKLISLSVKQSNTRPIFGTGISILIASLITPFINIFDIPTSLIFNISVIVFLLIVSFIFLSYLNKMFQRHLNSKVNINELQKSKLLVRPRSLKYIIKFLFSYFFILLFIVMGSSLYLIHGNALVLVITLFLLAFLFLISLLAIPVGEVISHSKHKEN
ncbi:DUF443 family protein [Virgibacillus halodenitrificans]|jgi:uncharacterized membrane protein (TIGR01218 family)|uniref:DUF443 family protein n=1 Tax=Virgibacillus halodenitrificans TaxID=1482 RepID=A0AAC9J2M2_VIRHA|nr:DUF443 family protein [Virgibacillus halodenitrificans]APC49407.1 hypothetical protein BME96_14930 [Virgibacillus halodenitrificans]